MDNQALFKTRPLHRESKVASDFAQAANLSQIPNPMKEKKPSKVIGGLKAWRTRNVRKKQSLIMQIGFLALIVTTGVQTIDPTFRASYALPFALLIGIVGVAYVWQENKLLD